MVFGRDKAAADLHISGSQIRTAINALKSTNNITVKTTNKFSIITVVNWQTYQSDQVSIDQQVDQQTDKQLASKSPTTRHKQEVKELKKETKLSFLDLIPANLRTDGFKTSWDEWLKFRKEIGKPIVETTAKRQLKALGEYSPDIAVSTISLSIEKGWMGLFPEKVNTPSLPATVSKVPPSWLHS